MVVLLGLYRCDHQHFVMGTHRKRQFQELLCNLRFGAIDLEGAPKTSSSVEATSHKSQRKKQCRKGKCLIGRRRTRKAAISPASDEQRAA